MTVQSEFERKKADFYGRIDDEYKSMRDVTLEELQEAVWSIGINEASMFEKAAFNAAWQEFQNDKKDLK